MSIESSRVVSNSEYNRLLAGYNRAANLERELASLRNGNIQLENAVQRIIETERAETERVRQEATARYNDLNTTTQRELSRMREILSQQNDINASNSGRIDSLNRRVDLLNQQLDQVNFRVDSLYVQVEDTNARVDALYSTEERRRVHAETLIDNAENLLGQMTEMDLGNEDKDELDRFRSIIDNAEAELRNNNPQTVSAILDSQFNRDMLLHYHILSDNLQKRPSLIARANELCARLDARFTECDNNEVAFADEENNITKYPCPVGEWCGVEDEDGNNFYETIRTNYGKIRSGLENPAHLGTRALEQMIDVMSYDLDEVLSGGEDSLVGIANENRLRQLVAHNTAQNLISQSECRGWHLDERADSETIGPITMRISNDFEDSVIISVNPGDEPAVYREVFSSPSERAVVNGEIINILSASGIKDDGNVKPQQLQGCSADANESMRRLSSQKN